jgi:hypothetical protein
VKRLKARIGALEDDAKAKDARISELRAEVDEGRTLVAEMREHVAGTCENLDGWIEAFDMVLGDDGNYRWVAGMAERNAELHERYMALLREWNAFVPRYNAVVTPRHVVGRPLAASEAQVREVHALRKAGKSLRQIATLTGLGLRTVQTITGKAAGTDRTSAREALRRLEVDRTGLAGSRRRQRFIAGLPKRVNAAVKDGADLLKRAGVSRAR